MLARLRDTDLAAQVERAKALRDEARVAYDRQVRLSDEELLSRQERDSAAGAPGGHRGRPARGRGPALEDADRGAVRRRS